MRRRPTLTELLAQIGVNGAHFTRFVRACSGVQARDMDRTVTRWRSGERTHTLSYALAYTCLVLLSRMPEELRDRLLVDTSRDWDDDRVRRARRR